MNRPGRKLSARPRIHYVWESSMKETTTSISHGKEGGGRFAAWFFLAVVCSLALHALFRALPHMDDLRILRRVVRHDRSRTFRMKRVEIDPSTLEETVNQRQEAKAEPRPVVLPSEKPSVDSRKTPDMKQSAASLLKAPPFEGDHPVAETARSGGEPHLDAESLQPNCMEGNSKAPVIPVDPLKDLGGGTGGSAVQDDIQLAGYPSRGK